MTSSIKAGWTPLFPKYPFSGDGTVLAFLNAKEVAVVQRVAKSWLNHPRFLPAKELAVREDAHCIKEGYPEEMVKAFRLRGLSLWRLPVIDMSTRDFDLSIFRLRWAHEAPVGCSAMRFTNLKGRVGVALEVHGHADGRIGARGADDGAWWEIDQLHGIVSLYDLGHHYTEPGNPLHSWGHDRFFGDDVAEAYWSKHEPHHTTGQRMIRCSTCPTFDFTNTHGLIDFTRRILSNTDPIFKLHDKVLQVETPLPAPVAVPAETGFFSCLAAFAEWIVSFVRSLLSRLGF